MDSITRRDLVKRAAIAGLAGSVMTYVQSLHAAEVAAPTSRPVDASLDSATLHWLEPVEKTGGVATTVGVPWPMGLVKGDQSLAVRSDKDEVVAAQSWPIAFWPDGSLKWSAHSFVPPEKPAGAYRIVQEKVDAPKTIIRVTENTDSIEIDTGAILATINRTGETLIESIKRGQQDILRSGRLVASIDDGPRDDSAKTTNRELLKSSIKSVVVEQSGPVRVVVKIDGTHVGDSGRSLLPFSLRLYFHAGSDSIRIMHSFIYDANEQKDFLSSIGMRFSVPMREQLHDRHIRFVGTGHGLFAEGIRPVTGLRRDPGQNVRKAQIDGVATPSTNNWPRAVADRLDLIPAWGDFTLTQLSADGYNIKKRTKAGFGWIPAAAGKRAAGVGYIGSASGGVAFGMRDFWQKHPAQIDVRNAHTDLADVTLWLWSPEAQPMDMRFYHDEMGMQTYPKQIEGLNITYEDYEPGYGTPFGIARTSEFQLRALPATPSRRELVEFADAVRTPPQLMCDANRFLRCEVFGGIWTLPDRSHPTKAALEDYLDKQLSQYVKEVDQRSWYGFWDFGDVMHSYDTDRNVWRYDIGGFAWDNCELSTDLWLWYSFLRTGRADVFRLAEAMSRHTGEVDVYHIGRFKGLGTRHGVQHWADSSKQSRISTSIYRRIHYFLTADERVGDLLREQLHTIETEKKIVVGRKLNGSTKLLPLPSEDDPTPGGEVGLGPMGYCNAAAAWITEAERTNDPKLHTYIINSMKGIGDLPYGFLTSGWNVNIDTGAINYNGSKEITISHLSSMFGMPEMCAELIHTYGQHAPKFAWAYSIYGLLYSASRDEKLKEIGIDFKGGAMVDVQSRMIAFAAKYRGDKSLAERAWEDFFGRQSMFQRLERFRPQHLEGPDVLNPIDAIPMGTNGVAQWGLAAIQNLKLIGDSIP